MAKDDKPRDLIGYDALQQDALRGVIRAALRKAADMHGLPGDHHFYISFRTRATLVAIPPELVARYPDEMTIVLQNQYWDLNPGDTAFSVTLQFNGQPKSLSIPYAAVTRFYDPSVQFLLHFNPPPVAESALPASFPGATTEKAKSVVDMKAAAPGAEGPNVVSLRDFRKK